MCGRVRVDCTRLQQIILEREVWYATGAGEFRCLAHWASRAGRYECRAYTGRVVHGPGGTRAGWYAGRVVRGRREKRSAHSVSLAILVASLLELCWFQAPGVDWAVLC